MVGSNEQREEKIKLINQLLENLNAKVNDIEEGILKDRQSLTAVGNGVAIGQEEVICDFLNNRSAKLNKIIT